MTTRSSRRGTSAQLFVQRSWATVRESFQKYDYDFYKVDPLLFSPAVVTIHNLRIGRTWSTDQIETDVLRQSFLSMSDRDPARFLCLGAGEGWHADQLRSAAACSRLPDLHFATYESLSARVGRRLPVAACMRCRIARRIRRDLDSHDAGRLVGTDHVSIGHAAQPSPNRPRPHCSRSSIHRVRSKSPSTNLRRLRTLPNLGSDVPETIVVQSRARSDRCIRRAWRRLHRQADLWRRRSRRDANSRRGTGLVPPLRRWRSLDAVLLRPAVRPARRHRHATAGHRRSRSSAFAAKTNQIFAPMLPVAVACADNRTDERSKSTMAKRICQFDRIEVSPRST